MMLQRFWKRVEEKTRDNSSAPVLICALGDSVTQGCMEAGKFDFKHVYHRVLQGMLEARFPKTTFSVINAGVGGESAAGGLQRLARDVLRHAPDLTLVAFGLNDSTQGVKKISIYRRNLGKIFAGIRANCQSDIIAVTPGFMANHRNPRIARQHRRFTKAIIRSQTGGALKSYVEALKESALAAGVPVADVHAQWEKLAARGKNTDDLLVNGLNHPNATGHQLAARTILQTLLASRPLKP